MRLHLFEWEDLAWFPDKIRNFMTDFLSFVGNRLSLFDNCLPVLRQGLERSGGHQILDLASGGGGALIRLGDELRQSHPDLEIVLSDFYPHLGAFQKTVDTRPDLFSFVSIPMDARNVENNRIQFRTQFQSFHHFPPHEARQILQNAVDANVVIGIFEAQKRDLRHLVRFCLSPAFVLAFTPWIRPFRWDRLLFTYAIPLVPVCIWWDGLVSVLRTYRVDELRAMISSLDGFERYGWLIDDIQRGPLTNVCLLGWPLDSTESSPSAQTA